MTLDLSTYIAAWLGITLEQLGTYGIAVTALCAWLLLARPRARAALARAGAWCEGKRKAAALTATPVDDYAVSALAGLVWLVSGLFELLLLVAAALAELARAIPEATKRAREAKASAASFDDGPPTRPLRRVPLAGATLLAFLLLPLAGCGASALERHTVVASVFHRASEGSARVIEAEARAAVAKLPTAEEVHAAIERRRPIEAGQHLFASSVDAYVTALLLVAADETPDLGDAVRAGARVLAVYADLARLAAELGVELPALAPAALRLLGGGL